MIVAGTKMAARGEAGRDHVSEMFLRRRTMFCDSMEVSREKERCQEPPPPEGRCCHLPKWKRPWNVTTGTSALEVYTPKEIFVANGTQGKLTCKFKSTNTTGTLTSVSWSFQPEGTDTTVSFFHYSQGQVYPGNYPPFKDRISWAGDLDKKDASINIENMQFIHNGTYICDVKNPPDIVAQPGHIRLYVVEKETLPVFPVWVVVGIVTAVVLGLTLLISMILAVLYRRRNSKRDYTGCSTSESVSPVKQAPRKPPSDPEGLAKSLPAASHQGPVIYAQLDHSGGHHSDRINKSESVVYADIRKN